MPGVVVNGHAHNTHNNMPSNSFRCEALKINCRRSKNSDPSTFNRPETAEGMKKERGWGRQMAANINEN